MARRIEHPDPITREKQNRCRQFQNFLHHQKKNFIEQLAALLLPVHMQKEDTKVILREIRKVFEKKFPERIGQENGCVFRRTMEYGDVRRSIWATCDLSKNFRLFQAKMNKGIKMEIEEESDVEIVIKRPPPVIKKEPEAVDEMDPGVDVLPQLAHQTQIPPLDYIPPLPQAFMLTPEEQWELLNALPPRPPTPNPFQAEYPEQRTPFGISFHQQLEYQQTASDLAAYASTFPPFLPTNVPAYQPAPMLPFQHFSPQPLTSTAPMLRGHLDPNFPFAAVNPISPEFLAPLNFEHELAHNWTLAASPQGSPLTEEQKALFDFPKLWN